MRQSLTTGMRPAPRTSDYCIDCGAREGITTQAVAGRHLASCLVVRCVDRPGCYERMEEQRKAGRPRPAMDPALNPPRTK